MNQHETVSPGAEVHRYVRALKRRAQYVLLPVVLVPCAVLVGLTFVGPVYESSSVVIYEEKLPFAREMGDIMVQKREESYGNTDRLAQIEARLKSGLFLGEVVKKLDVGLKGGRHAKGHATKMTGITPAELEHRVVVETLRKSIKIAETGPDLFKITVSNPDRETAFRLADGATRSFVDYVTRGQVADIRAAGTFSADQLPVYEEKLRQSEQRLKQLRGQMATRSAAEGTPGEKNVESVKAVLNQTEMEIAELEGHRKTSRETMDANYPNAVNPVTLIRSNAIDDAYARVVKEEETGVPLLVRGGSTSSVMERVGLAREKLLAVIEETVRSVLRGSPDGLLSLVSEQVYDDDVIRSLEKRRSLVSGLMGVYSRAAGRRPQDEIELARVEQEVGANNTVLQSLRRQLTSSQISEAAQTTRLGVRIEVIEPATRPLTEAGPGKRKILVLAFLLGPFLGISFVVLSEYMDNSVKSVDDVKKTLGMAVLGTIPRVPGADFWQSTKRKRWPYVVILVAMVFTVFVQFGHEPILRLLGRENQGIEVVNFSESTGRVSPGNEQTGNDKTNVDQQ